MKQELVADDTVEITIEAGEFVKSISGKAEELELVGFPVEWISENPDEAESFSDVIGEFRCSCHDEFMSSYGSYDEFSQSYKIIIKVDGL